MPGTGTVGRTTSGSTIRNIAGAPLMGTERRHSNSVVRPVEILWVRDKTLPVRIKDSLEGGSLASTTPLAEELVAEAERQV